TLEKLFSSRSSSELMTTIPAFLKHDDEEIY
ncbi:hypothetical protein NPIL_210961, partial [Nephila pilipes]